MSESRLCGSVRDHLNSLSDREHRSDWRDMANVLAHCLCCAPCRTYHSRLKLLRRTARRLPVLLPSGLRERTLAQLPVPVAEGALNRTPVQAEGRNREMASASTATPRRTEFGLWARNVKVQVIVTAAAMAAAAGFGVVTVEGMRPLSPPHAAQQNRDPERVAEFNARMDDPARNAEFLSWAERLRDSWKPWAMEHKEQLRSMLRERGTSRAAFDSVRHTLSRARIYDEGRPLSYRSVAEQNPAFARVFLGDHPAPRGPALAIENEERAAAASLHFGLTRYHDIALVCSAKPGTKFVLWTSGRITMTTYSTALDPGPPVTEKPVENWREVKPPYDELRR